MSEEVPAIIGRTEVIGGVRPHVVPALIVAAGERHLLLSQLFRQYLMPMFFPNDHFARGTQRNDKGVLDGSLGYSSNHWQMAEPFPDARGAQHRRG